MSVVCKDQEGVPSMDLVVWAWPASQEIKSLKTQLHWICSARIPQRQHLLILPAITIDLIHDAILIGGFAVPNTNSINLELPIIEGGWWGNSFLWYYGLSLPQEYIGELQRLLDSAKHPKVVALLQGALTEAKPKQNGVGATADSTAPDGDTETKPLSKQKEKSVSMAKITSYGRCGQCMVKES